MDGIKRACYKISFARLQAETCALLDERQQLRAQAYRVAEQIRAAQLEMTAVRQELAAAAVAEDQARTAAADQNLRTVIRRKQAKFLFF
jgi:regulator of replication initiation timing